MSIQIQIGADISGVDKAIKSVSGELNNLKAPVANASNALNSLSQVTRDLPFGFIAIQNNLPLVVDSFGQLTKQAGGLGPALKSIGASLIGPAGLSFAFGAVVAGVTALIQKYGSLGEAFNALLGIAPRLTENQKEFNKAVSEASGNVALEEAKIKILVSTLNNLDAPQKQRIEAYNELKKVSPDVVAGIRDENALTAASIDIINKSSEARLQAIKLKIQEAGISAVLTKNAEQLAIKQQELNLASKEYVTNAAAFTKAQNQSNVSGLAGVQVQQAAFNAFKTSAAEVNALQLEIKKLNADQEQYLKQLEPIVTQTAAINTATKERINNLKTETTAQKENTKAIKENVDVLRTALERRAQNTSDNPFIPNLNKKLRESRIGLEKFRKDNVEAPIIQKRAEIIPSQSFIDAQNRIKQLQNTFAVAKSNLEGVFFNPLTDLFSNFFETGKLAFADFGKTILKTISQIVSKIIATGIINLLANLLLPGAGLASGAAKGIGGAFTSAIGSVLGIGNISNPSFAGVGGGTLGMSGQVNVVLRGQDLVGAINRTNSTINRVG
jgi:hypothetical protein